MAEQNFTVDTGLTVTGTGGNITGANNIIAANSVSVSGNAGDITMTGGNITGFTALVGNTANVTLTANTQSWTFDTTGELTVPGNVLIPTGQLNITGNTNNTAIVIGNGAVNNCAIAMIPAEGTAGQFAFRDYSTANSMMFFDTTIGSANTGGGFVFRGSSSFTEYAIINDLGISTTGNILGNGYSRFSGTFDESQASTAGIYAGYAGGTPRMMFGTGNTLQTLEIDNDGGTLRFYKPGTTLASLTNTGVFTATGAMQLTVYADTTTRDAAITSPQPGMMVYITGTGMQVRGATSWNTIIGSGT